jgi:CheY-like chemotaxis protein
MRIVLVEDSSDDAFMLERTLNKGGLVFSMELLVDGKEALDYLQDLVNTNASRPDLIILDVNLPCHSGFEILQWIKSQDALRSTPVLVHTGSSLPQDTQKVLDLGASAFLTKSYDGSKVVTVIQEIMDKAPPARLKTCASTSLKRQA